MGIGLSKQTIFNWWILFAFRFLAKRKDFVLSSPEWILSLLSTNQSQRFPGFIFFWISLNRRIYLCSAWYDFTLYWKQKFCHAVSLIKVGVVYLNGLDQTTFISAFDNLYESVHLLSIWVLRSHIIGCCFCKVVVK